MHITLKEAIVIHCINGGVFINEVFCGPNNSRYKYLFFRDTIHMRMIK